MCQGHVRFTSPIQAPIPPQCPSGYCWHLHQGIPAEPARHQRMLWSTRDASPLPPSSGAGMPLLGAVRGQGCFGEHARSGEKHLQACGQVTGQPCPLKQQTVDLFPASSRGTQREVNVLPHKCRSGQAAPASMFCVPRTLQRN